MSAATHSSQIQLPTLADIFDEKNFSATSQLKYNATKKVFYSDSEKTVGKFWDLKGAFFSFYARFISRSFSKANEQLVETIRQDFGDDAAKAFQKEFGNRFSYGQPITAERVRSFVIPLSTMVNNANKLFAKGTVKKGSAKEIAQRYELGNKSITGPQETETVLTSTLQSTAKMKMMLDDLHKERLMPLACAQFYGEEDREKLLEQALHAPNLQAKHLVQRLGEIGKEIEKYNALEQKLAPMESLSSETCSELATVTKHLSEEIERYKSQFTSLEEKLKDSSLSPDERTGITATLESLTLQLEEADTKRLSLLPYAAADEALKASGAADLSRLKTEIKEKKEALIQKQKSFEGYQEWPAYKLAAVAKADSLLALNAINLHSIQAKLTQTSDNLIKIKSEEQNADDSQKAKLQEKIAQLEDKLSALKDKESAFRSDVNAIQTTLRNLTDKAKAAEWDQKSSQAILNFVNKTTPEKIEFDRIQVKVNGKILPLKGTQSEENFEIFKSALRQLALSRTPPLKISDDQIREMLTLCSCEKTAEGFPAGKTGTKDDLPSFGIASPLIEGKIDSYEIVIPEDSPTSIDFQFHSAKALLTKIQYQGGDQNKEQLISTRNEDGLLPENFQKFERSCSFTYRYSPKAREDGPSLNMEHGNLDLIKSQQAFWPISDEEIKRLTTPPIDLTTTLTPPLQPSSKSRSSPPHEAQMGQ